jgi:hypothetical protein
MRGQPLIPGGYQRNLVHFLAAPLLAGALALAPGGPACAGGTPTVAMTAGDIPVTTGNPDQGFEGYRFVGYNLYDGLLLWDLSKSENTVGGPARSCHLV